MRKCVRQVKASPCSVHIMKTMRKRQAKHLTALPAGQCERQCPQHIGIIKCLQDVAAALE